MDWANLRITFHFGVYSTYYYNVYFNIYIYIFIYITLLHYRIYRQVNHFGLPQVERYSQTVQLLSGQACVMDPFPGQKPKAIYFRLPRRESGMIHCWRPPHVSVSRPWKTWVSKAWTVHFFWRIHAEIVPLASFHHKTDVSAAILLI